VTIDFETLEDGCVTLRDRDTLKQERVKIEDLSRILVEKTNMTQLFQ
jgi:glycyl-tRNA synthetase